LANTKTQRTKKKNTKEKVQTNTQTAVATNTIGGQQKKYEGGGLSKQVTQTEATRAGPAQNIVAKDAKGASTKQERW